MSAQKLTVRGFKGDRGLNFSEIRTAFFILFLIKVVAYLLIAFLIFFVYLLTFGLILHVIVSMETSKLSTVIGLGHFLLSIVYNGFLKIYKVAAFISIVY